MRLKVCVAALIAAFGVSPMANAASNVSLDTFPEFNGCMKAGGTWWQGNAGDKYTYGHNSSFTITGSVMTTKGDWDPVASAGTPIRSIERKGNLVVIVINSGSRWELAKQGDKFVGTTYPQNGLPGNIEFDCKRPPKA